MRDQKKSILVVLPDFFLPLNSGGHIRTYHMLKSLVLEYQVTVICRAPAHDELLNDPIRAQIKIIPVKAGDSKKGGLSYWIRLRNLVWRATPRIRVFCYQLNYASALKKLLGQTSFDIVMVEHSFMAMYAPLVRELSSAKTVMVAHNCEWVTFSRVLQNTKLSSFLLLLGRLQLSLIKRRESRLYRQFDLCIAVSDKEKILWQQTHRDWRVDVIENGTDTSAYYPERWSPNPYSLLFIGSLGYFPNKDAVLYLVNDILPLIAERIPSVELYVVGRGESKEIQALASDRVHIVGEVLDVNPYLERATVSVCPLRIGGGTRLKILESFAAGVPMVSTEIGAEGLRVVHGENIMLASTAQEFSDATVELLENTGRRSALAKSARELVTKHYDWQQLGKRQNQLLNELMKGR